MKAGPGRGKKGKTGGLRKNPPVYEKKSLANQGIDKNLADRARKAAALPEKEFEAEVERAVRTAVAAVEGDTASSARRGRRSRSAAACLAIHARRRYSAPAVKLGNERGASGGLGEPEPVHRAGVSATDDGVSAIPPVPGILPRPSSRGRCGRCR
jgi:hypothetical protein